MLKSRLVMYPILTTTALFCAEPIFERGLGGGFQESLARAGVAAMALLFE
jgi:hypothetical protein